MRKNCSPCSFGALSMFSTAAAIAIGCGMPAGGAIDAANVTNASAQSVVAGVDLGEVQDAATALDADFAFAATPAGEDSAAPGRGARGGFGRRGPHGGDPPGDPGRAGFGWHAFGPRIAERLALTDEQKTQARTLFDGAREQADALRATAVTNIRALLTTEQIAALDAALNRVRDRVEQAWAEGRPPHAGPGARAHGLRKLVDDLALTDEQRTAIGDLRSELRTALRTLRETTRTQFHAILTEEQRQLIQTWRENRPHRGPGGRARVGIDGEPGDELPPSPPDEVDMVEHELALADEE